MNLSITNFNDNPPFIGRMFVGVVRMINGDDHGRVDCGDALSIVRKFFANAFGFPLVALAGGNRERETLSAPIDEEQTLCLPKRR